MGAETASHESGWFLYARFPRQAKLGSNTFNDRCYLGVRFPPGLGVLSAGAVLDHSELRLSNYFWKPPAQGTWSATLF